MSQQPYEPYGQSYDPHQQPQQAVEQPQQPYPEQRSPQAAAARWPQGGGYEESGRTRTFQGQAGDTGYKEPQQAAAGTGYLPPQTPQPHRGEPMPAPASTSTPPAQTPAADDGNAGLTYAQWARLEGRSPIIAPGLKPAGLTAILALLLAGGAALGSYGLLVPLLLLQALTAAGWFRLNGMWPARQGIALAFLGGVVADAMVLLAGRENAPAALLGTGGVWVLLTLVLQLRSHAGADERMHGLMATVSSAALTILAAGSLAATPEAVTVGGVAVGVAALARALPLPGVASVVVALLVAAGAGIAVGALTGMGSAGALLGAGAGVCALVGLRVASYDYPSRFVHMTAGVALPLTAAVPALYLLGRVVV